MCLDQKICKRIYLLVLYGYFYILKDHHKKTQRRCRSTFCLLLYKTFYSSRLQNAAWIHLLNVKRKNNPGLENHQSISYNNLQRKQPFFTVKCVDLCHTFLIKVTKDLLFQEIIVTFITQMTIFLTRIIVFVVVMNIYITLLSIHSYWSFFAFIQSNKKKSSQ